MNIELNGQARQGIATVADAVAAVLGLAARERAGRDDSRQAPTAPESGTAAARDSDLRRLGRGTAVAVNGEVVPRSEWDRPLADGDTVEVLTATQGG